jgi:hypothetical protein
MPMSRASGSLVSSSFASAVMGSAMVMPPSCYVREPFGHLPAHHLEF